MAGGIKARTEGIYFEHIIQRLADKESIHCIPMPLGARRVGKNKLFQIKTPFDFVLIKEGSVYFIDCKSHESDTFSYSSLTTHQVNALCQIAKAGSAAGYLVWFRNKDKVSFFASYKLRELKPRESLKHTDGIELGNISTMSLSILFEMSNYLFSIEPRF